MPTLEEAIKAIKAGDKATGQELLAEILQSDYDNEIAWLWLSGVVESDERRRQCLERVLEINPDNEAARRGLAKLPKSAEDVAKELEEMQAQSRLRQASPLQARLSSAREKRPDRPKRVTPPPEAEPEETDETEELSPSAKPESEPANQPEPEAPLLPPQPQAAGSTSIADRLSAAAASAPAPSAAPAPTPPAAKEASPIPVPSSPDEDLAASRPVAEASPATEQGLLAQLARYSNTSQGTLLIGGGLSALVLICIVCIIGSVFFQPTLNRVSGGVLGFGTPTATVTPLPTNTPLPTARTTFAPTPLPTETATPTTIATRVVPNTPTITPIPSPTPTPEPVLESGQVVGVASGDEITVEIDGVELQVKYILVDAPDFNGPDSDPEPFGAEALQFNRLLVEDRTVTLENDVSDTDEFGRLLRYVYIGDLMVNEEMLRQGLARVEMIPPDLKYGARLQAVEETAREAGVGIWSLETTP